MKLSYFIFEIIYISDLILNLISILKQTLGPSKDQTEG